MYIEQILSKYKELGDIVVRFNRLEDVPKFLEELENNSDIIWANSKKPTEFNPCDVWSDSIMMKISRDTMTSSGGAYLLYKNPNTFSCIYEYSGVPKKTTTYKTEFINEEELFTFLGSIKDSIEEFKVTRYHIEVYANGVTYFVPFYKNVIVFLANLMR